MARRRGKRNALMTVLSLGILAFVGDWFFYDPVLPALQLLASGRGGLRAPAAALLEAMRQQL